MNALVVLGGIVSIGFLMVFSSIFNGYALSVLWGWFVVPTFGAPVLHIVPAIGVTMVVKYMTHQMHDYKKEEKGFVKSLAEGIGIAILRPSFVLFLGWIVHLFM